MDKVEKKKTANDNLSLLNVKETAEFEILKIIRELNEMSRFYGIEKLKKAIELLQEVRLELLVDLEKYVEENEND